MPGDFNGDGLVTITDAVRFTQEYVRWQADPQPTFDADTDDIYDLAPHTQVAWPNWVKIGDHVIDALDAAAFEECWTQAHTLAPSNRWRAQATRRHCAVRMPPPLRCRAG